MDIPAAANIALGTGWFQLETYGTQNFRWVTNDAEIYVAALKKSKHYLQLYLEPGPGVNLSPFDLQIKEGNKTIGSATIKGRQMVSFELPAAEPGVHTLRLHAEVGGEPLPSDSRVLNFRIFKIAFFPPIVDILPPELDARLGKGWHPLETFEGEAFRWTGNNANITILDAGDSRELVLELEPGPGVNSQPFVLHVVDDAGHHVATIDVETRQRIAIPIAAPAGQPLSLFLQAEGGGQKIQSDDRVLNFRVFQHSTDLRAPGDDRSSPNL